MKTQDDFFFCELKARKLYDQICKRRLNAYRFTKNEMEIIRILSRDDICTAKEIAVKGLMAKSHVSQSVDSLNRNGYIVGKQDTEDRRCIRLSLTSRTDAFIKDMNQVQKEFEKIVFAGMTKEEKQVLERVVYKMIQNINTASGEETE